MIAEQTEAFDAVAIIRGGGGEVGLSSYNNYLLARAIAIFPIPVLTGIGHSTNETVSEMVAYKNAITPSELADFLIQKFHNFAIPVDQAQRRMVRACQAIFTQQEAQLQHFSQQISWSGKSIFMTQRNKIDNIQSHLQLFSRQLLKEHYAEIENASRLVNLASPKQILRRGFSITRVAGKAITDVNEVPDGATVETELLHGTIHSTTQSKT